MQSANQKGAQDLRLMTAGIGVVLLIFHLYYYCYAAFSQWHLTAPIVDRIAANMAHKGLFRHRAVSKLAAWFFLALSLIGKSASASILTTKGLTSRFILGLACYLGSDVVLALTAVPTLLATVYIGITGIGLYLMYECSGLLISKLSLSFGQDVFNRQKEQFPQQEKAVHGPYTLQLKGKYRYQNRVRESVINLEIVRGTMIAGLPGCGKTRHLFRPLIQQSIAKGMTMLVYDFKYPNLTNLTYDTLERCKSRLKHPPFFFSINFDELEYSHRCNVLEPWTMTDISDAAESARTILYATNKQMIGKQGDFWVESAVAFVTATMWFLRRYENGRYCSLPHAVELSQTDFYKLFSILRSYEELQSWIGPFASALENNSMPQLQGQVDSARIALAGLSSPQVYYVLSASDFTLDINNPKAPKIVCIGSNPQKQFVYGAVISLYITRLFRMVNKPGQLPCHIPIDEFPSLSPYGIHLTLAQARENRVAVTLGIQDISQLRMEYGRDTAEAIFNLPSNLICGQVSGDSARLVSERIGKIQQEQNTLSTNSRDTSTSESYRLDPAVPPSKISTLSAGEFVGITSDTPDQPILLKAFHSHIPVDNKAIAKEEAGFKPRRKIRTVDQQTVLDNFVRIKREVRELVDAQLAAMRKDPNLKHLIITPKRP
jgi:hypothetical protein